ncbi:MAG: hypothetical protein ABIQ55_00350 [Gemmatimonadaceae bacterium]
MRQGRTPLRSSPVDAAIQENIPASVALLFAPVDKRAFGAAIGIAAAMLIAGVTIATLLSSTKFEGLGLLENYFGGYSVSWPGALIGGAWAFGVGFIAGWLLAFIRNFSLAVSLFLIRSKADFNETSDFLDHI